MIEAKEYFCLTPPREIVTAILENRGIKDTYDFLHPNQKDIIPLKALPFIDEASQIVIDGIANNKKFFINVDSDTDGVTSGAIIYRWLASNYVPIDWHVSIGKTHGTSDKLIEKLKKAKPSILVIVDSLDSDLENYKKIKEMGIDIIVLDHHDIDTEIDYSKYVTLVSSNYEDYPNHELSGAGVTWKFCKYCDSLLGTFDADELVDLAATGIIADMMDMSVMENRAIAHEGLSNFKNTGLRRILGPYRPNAKAISFSIAPLFNASCRYFKNEAAFRMLISEDLDELKDCHKVLKSCKEMQSDDIEAMKDDLNEQIELNKNRPFNFIVVDTEASLSGLIANKVLEETKKPTFVVKEEEDRYAGSARASMVGNFREMCSDTNLCLSLGHPGAFGFFLDYRNTDNFFEEITKRLSACDMSDKAVEVDAEIDLEDVDDDLVERVEEANWISGNKYNPLQFKVVLDDFSVDTLKNGVHVVIKTKNEMKFIKWNSGKDFDRLSDAELMGDKVVVCGSFEQSRWGGKKENNMIVDRWEIVDGRG